MLRESHRPGIEPATCKSQVKCLTAEPPRDKPSYACEHKCLSAVHNAHFATCCVWRFFQRPPKSFSSSYGCVSVQV